MTDGGLRARTVLIGGAIAISMACALTDFLPPGLGTSEVATESSRVPVDGALSSIEGMVHSTVQVLAMVKESDEWVAIWSGSGSVISKDGLILTNSHVVDTSFFEYDALGVALTDRSDRPPLLSYLAEVLAQDPLLDLAVIRVVSDLAGNEVAASFSSVAIGNSDNLEIGDSLRILGYPGIGGETITLTEGAVSGFTLERGIDGRAWIKTDATIAGGNSGGMGTNTAGELIGVPTIVTSGSEAGQTVDCRSLADTDRDGDIDENDTCVPVGGFINALRPVNLALPLIDAARRGQQYAAGSRTEDQGEFDPFKATFFNLSFSDGVTGDDQPMQIWYALPPDSTHVCAFWDYGGMANGVSWSSYWFFNGQLDEGGSTPDQGWGGGKSGNWWVCLIDESGLSPGVYELVLEVEGTILATDSAFVGGDRRAAEFALENLSPLPICIVNLSPTGASNWGQNELAEGDVVQPSEIRLIPLATGEYDIRLVGCDNQSLSEQFAVEISRDYYLGFEG